MAEHRKEQINADAQTAILLNRHACTAVLSVIGIVGVTFFPSIIAGPVKTAEKREPQKRSAAQCRVGILHIDQRQPLRVVWPFEPHNLGAEKVAARRDLDLNPLVVMQPDPTGVGLCALARGAARRVIRKITTPNRIIADGGDVRILAPAIIDYGSGWTIKALRCKVIRQRYVRDRRSSATGANYPTTFTPWVFDSKENASTIDNGTRYGFDADQLVANVSSARRFCDGS